MTVNLRALKFDKRQIGLSIEYNIDVKSQLLDATTMARDCLAPIERLSTAIIFYLVPNNHLIILYGPATVPCLLTIQ